MALTTRLLQPFFMALTARLLQPFFMALTARLLQPGSYSLFSWLLQPVLLQLVRLLQPDFKALTARLLQPLKLLQLLALLQRLFWSVLPPSPHTNLAINLLKKPCHICKENSNKLTCFLLSVLCLWGVTSRTITFCHMLKNTNQDCQKQAEKNQCWFAYHFKED